MNAVIYARFSSDKQREESIDGQLRECKEYAARNKINVVGEYIDRALSASKETEKRLDFQRMISDSAKGNFQIVLVWKLDRFARSRYDSSLYKSILKRNGVRVVSATEAISDSPEGIILESLLEGMAEYYSAELSEKVKRGRKENALKGLINGGNLPFGYMKGPERKLIIREREAEIVRYIFETYCKGLTVEELIKDLIGKGITNHRGRPFSKNNLYYILKNRAYIGEYRSSGVVIPNGLPAIVSEELFNKAQIQKKSNIGNRTSFKARERYILSGKVFCGDCGSKMVGECGYKGPYANYYYKCIRSKKREGCGRSGIKKHWLEDFVIERIVKVLMDEAFLERLINKVYDLQDDKDPDLSFFTDKLEQNSKARSNLIKAIESGIATTEAKNRYDELENERKELEAAVFKAEKSRRRLSIEEITQYVYSFRYLDYENIYQRKQLVDMFINSIFVYTDRIIITFNYREDADVVVLDDIKEQGLDSTDMCKQLSRDIVIRDKGFGVMFPIQYEGFSRKRR